MSRPEDIPPEIWALATFHAGATENAECIARAIIADRSQRDGELEAVRAELKACGHKSTGEPLHILVDRAIDAERERISVIRQAVAALEERAQQIYPRLSA